MRTITILALAAMCTSVFSGEIEAKKKSADQRVSIETHTRDLKAPYGQPVKASGSHVLVFKNVFNADMKIEYFYSLKVNGMHFDKRELITIPSYSEKRIELESAIYNIVFGKGKYPIIACTATVDTGSVCDHKTLTVY